MKKIPLFLFIVPLLCSSCCKEPSVEPENGISAGGKINAPLPEEKISPLAGYYQKIEDDNASNPLPQIVQVYFEEDAHRIAIKDQAFELLYTGDPYYLSSMDPNYTESFHHTPQKGNTVARVEIFEELMADEKGAPIYRVNLIYWDEITQQANYTTAYGAIYKRIEK